MPRLRIQKKREMNVGIWWDNLMESGCLEDLGVEEKIPEKSQINVSVPCALYLSGAG
jgi:hypothetical protein